MPETTYYVVQPFRKAKKGGRVVPGIAQEAPSKEAALARLRAIREGRVRDTVGGLAFCRTGDVTTGDWGDAQMLGLAGYIPEEALASPDD